MNRSADMIPDIRHAVLLAGVEIGVLHQRGDHVRFSFLPEYWDNPERHVLGLWFEDHRGTPVSSALRLPAWFANLLPEGRLRSWIASERGVSLDREMELLAQVGHDLPGAVQVVDGAGLDLPWTPGSAGSAEAGVRLQHGRIKFSLAGIGLKFSMRREGERYTLPASGTSGGQWIVKLPDPEHRAVPQNEFAIMTLARSAGIDVPEVHLVSREDTFGVPDHAWPQGETFALAVKRFDRSDDGSLVHIEDFAQVRGFMPQHKYDGAFETVAALCYRGRDEKGLHEFVRRMVFNVLVGNGDAHLKNWSLIYPDGRNPTLSPAYDLVSTAPYLDREDLGLRFARGRRFEDFSLVGLGLLEQRLAVPAGSLVAVARDAYARVADAWTTEHFTAETDFVRSWVESSISNAAAMFR